MGARQCDCRQGRRPPCWCDEAVDGDWLDALLDALVVAFGMAFVAVILGLGLSLGVVAFRAALGAW